MKASSILHVTAIPLTAEHFLLPLAYALRDSGHTVHFASAAGAEQTALEALGFPTHTIPVERSMTSPRNGQALLALIALMRQWRFQVVHAHTPIAGLLARLAARLTDTPAIFYTLHGSLWGGANTLRTRLFTLAEQMGSFCTDHVFVLNQSDQQELLRRRLYHTDQITNLGVGGGGVNLQRFRFTALSTTDRKKLRETWGIPADVPVIGYLGRMVREKGILDLVQAFVLVQKLLPSVHLLLAGGAVAGEWDAVSEAEILGTLGEQHALRNQIHITGFRRDVPELLSTMDVVVLPSWREGFGMALAEAGAMGLPVVATRTPGGEQAVVHGETGLLTPICRPIALADALTTILTNPALAQAMGQAGQHRASQYFDQQQLVLQQLAIYNQFCNRIPYGDIVLNSARPI